MCKRSCRHQEWRIQENQRMLGVTARADLSRERAEVQAHGPGSGGRCLHLAPTWEGPNWVSGPSGCVPVPYGSTHL